MRAAIEFCLRRGIEALTLFAFSRRTGGDRSAEVGALMELFLKALDREVDELHGYGVRIRFIGELVGVRAGVARTHARGDGRRPGPMANSRSISR